MSVGHYQEEDKNVGVERRRERQESGIKKRTTDRGIRKSTGKIRKREQKKDDENKKEGLERVLGR